MYSCEKWPFKDDSTSTHKQTVRQYRDRWYTLAQLGGGGLQCYRLAGILDVKLGTVGTTQNPLQGSGCWFFSVLLYVCNFYPNHRYALCSSGGRAAAGCGTGRRRAAFRHEEDESASFHIPRGAIHKRRHLEPAALIFPSPF